MKDIITFDLHTHHERCGHATDKIEDYIKAAIEQRLDYIGISDHTPYFYSEKEQLHPNIAMAKSEFPHYVKEILQLKEKYKEEIHVLLGIESDFFPEYTHFYQDQFNKYPFDYIIGSVHYVGGISIFNRKRWENIAESELLRTKEKYYTLIQQSAKSKMFQILGHIDAMKGFYPRFSDIETDSVDETLKVIGEADVAIEVNTSGKTKDAGGWYPSDDILERAQYYNVPITFGSDAHVPARVGDDFEKVRERLKSFGFKELVYFVNKKRYATPL